jgi:SAM-dependent methyltransferase
MTNRIISKRCPICQIEVDAILVEECEFGYKMLRCPDCHLEFAHPLKGPGKEGYEQWYKGETTEIKGERFSVDYASRLQSPNRRRLRDYHLKALCLASVLLSFSSKVLDVGCAEGSFIKALEEIGFDVYGCDIAEEPIGFAKRIYNLRNVLASSVENLPSHWQNFELITAFEVLEHLETPLEFLRSIFTILKPGGFLILSVPNYNYHSKKRIRGGAKWDAPPEHLTRWPEETLKCALLKVGFSFNSIKFLPAGGWESFLDAILPDKIENFYWQLWERKVIDEVKQGYGKEARSKNKSAEFAFRVLLYPFYRFLKSKYDMYCIVIARKGFQ